jgi:glycosyltransferase involved in cell wall biosynthesis
MRVAYITTDWGLLNRYGKPTKTPGGAGYYRCVLPAEALNEHTTDITARCFADAHSTINGELVPITDDGTWDTTGYDIIVLQRWMRAEVAQATRAAQAAGQVVVQDIDDHYWAVHHTNRAARETDPTRNPVWNREHYRNAILAADHVTVSTPFLAELIRQWAHPHVTVLPNMIDLRHWTPQPVQDTVATIGWVGATDYRSGDLEQVGTALRHHLRTHPDLAFVHGGHRTGAPPAARMLGVPGTTTVHRRPRQPIHRYPQLWAGIDVALCPLNPVDFNRAKSPIKAMEASAAGVPYIATDLDPYHDYGCGILVTTPTAWATALEQIMDTNTRQHLQRTAQHRVQREDVSVRWKDWDTLYRTLCLTAHSTPPPW